MSDLSQIEHHLKTLNLSTTRIPSFKEYKKAYRNLLKLHPDLGGDTKQFQEITLAAREVFDYLRTHQTDCKSECESDSDLLRAFESSNNVNYNTGNIVFDIKELEANLWVECLTKRVGRPLSNENDSLRYKVEDFKIPHMPSAFRTNYYCMAEAQNNKTKNYGSRQMSFGVCHIYCSPHSQRHKSCK